METQFAQIPMRSVGPILIKGPVLSEEILVPLATFETPLWPSTARGAKVSMLSGGIEVVIADDRMSRSIILEAESAAAAVDLMRSIDESRAELAAVVKESSRFCRLIDLHSQIVGNDIYLRFEMLTGDASGHNMVTVASDRLANWIVERFKGVRYQSISGNFCTDKKVSAVNGILGRGKNVIAEIFVPREICEAELRTAPEKIVELNIRKNLMGSIVAGGLRSANAHFANMLLAFYLATGQDAANIVEGSQGFVRAELRSQPGSSKPADGLYFSVTLPNLIVGTVGNGKDLPFVRENLERLGCLVERAPGANAARLAAICAATVLCGEISLLAAQTNPGELVRAHLLLERRRRASR